MPGARPVARRASPVVPRQPCPGTRSGRMGRPGDLNTEPEATHPHATRTHHRDHRPGRPVPLRAAARQGVRGARHHPRPEQPQARAGARRSCPTSCCTPVTSPTCPACCGRMSEAAARRVLQPRRRVVRGVLVGERPGDHRGHRQRRAQRARGGAAVLRAGPGEGALLPGVVVGDVRQGAGGAAAREDPAVAALALRRGQGLRALHDHQLPRVLRHARQLRHPVQPRVARAADRSSSPARCRWPSPRSRSACRTRSPWATSTPSATGASPATTSRACGGCCSSPRPTTTCCPPARRTRSASCSTPPSRRVGIDDWSGHVEQDPRFMRPAEVDLLVGDASKARERLGWKPTVALPRARRDDGRQRPRPAAGLDRPMSVALVTGATGQDGSYLVERLLAEGVEVHGLVRTEDLGGPLPDGPRRPRGRPRHRPRRARRPRRRGSGPTSSTTSAG